MPESVGRGVALDSGPLKPLGKSPLRVAGGQAAAHGRSEDGTRGAAANKRTERRHLLMRDEEMVLPIPLEPPDHDLASGDVYVRRAKAESEPDRRRASEPKYLVGIASDHGTVYRPTQISIASARCWRGVGSYFGSPP